MKTIEINFREPSIDRFVEIWAVAIKFGWPFYATLKNMPNGYWQFAECIGIYSRLLSLQNNPDFIIEFPEKVNYGNLFRRVEPIEDILNRINSVIEIENPQLKNDGALQLLKTATDRMNISKDDIQNIISLSCVIAAMDGEKSEIKAHHIAESIQYVIPKYKTND